MHIFVTGGTGFFGKALLRQWPQDVRLTLLSRDPGRFSAVHGDLLLGRNLRLAAGDVLQPHTLPTGDYTHILHAATDSTFGPQLSPLDRYLQIVDGTRNLLDFAVANKVSRFLLTSSGGVYGPQPVTLAQIPEDLLGMPDPLNPQHTYGVAKRCAEHLCALYQDRYGLEAVVARCFAFVGQDLPLDAHFAMGNFIRDALTASEIKVGGDGTPVRSYMDQRDLADWLLVMLTRGTAGQAYNVGSDEEITIVDLAKLVRDTLAPDKRVRIAGVPSINSFRNRYVPSIEKARAGLGLQINYPLHTSIREAALFAKF
jgi:dTDP-glucose 4,6-dehydratase